MLLLWVAVGGAAGALARWLLDSHLLVGSTFPWTTLVINVAGAFALGLLPAVAAVRRSPTLAAAIGPGLLGGFTTVSAWAGQIRALAAAGHVLLAGLYLGVTLAAGLAAAALGHHLAHQPDAMEALE